MEILFAYGKCVFSRPEIGNHEYLEKYGGVFASTGFDPEDACRLERYWIDLTK